MRSPVWQPDCVGKGNRDRGEQRTVSMDIRQDIRLDRARQKRKRPCQSSAFHTVGCIVKGYRLGEDFLKRLDAPEGGHLGQKTEFTEVKSKTAFEVPPFCLVSQEQYGLVMAIVAKLDNPYLAFARSPEEMLRSAPLYAANPSLEPRDLLHFDFETLLRLERAQEELVELLTRYPNAGGTISKGRREVDGQGEPPRLQNLQDRIEQLRAFVARAERTERQSG